ncbi:MAG: hypothetical protein LAT63_10140 [Marinobacter sp.]|nr:hypothetical protein [Marinobacter sp.]
MLTPKKALLSAAITSFALAGCLESGGFTDNNSNPQYLIGGASGSSGIVQGPHPVFRPLNSEFPLPSDALFFLNKANDGTMLNGNFTDPTQPDYNPVTAGLGYLDGNSVLAPFDIKISASLDAESLDARDFIDVDGEILPNPDQNILLIPLAYPGADPLFRAQGEVAGISRMDRYRLAQRLKDSDPTAAQAILDELMAEQEQVRIELISVDGGVDNAIRILPIKPLKAKTQYAVALTNGIRTAQGEKLVGAPQYQSIADPSKAISNVALQPFRDVMVPARQLAARYFQFKTEALNEASAIPGFADVVFSTTFTTTGIDDILLANAAPVTYFRSQTRIQARQDAVSRLISGAFNLTNQPLSENASADDQAINQRIYELLTIAGELTFYEQSIDLFDPDLALLLEEANAEGLLVRYNDLVNAGTPDTALLLQAAAAEAASDVLATALDNQAAQLAGQAEALLDTPKSRTTRIFSRTLGRDVNPALGQSTNVPVVGNIDVDIQVFQGEITLPYYQGIPDPLSTDGSPIQLENWQAADFSADPELANAKTDRVTYRFPFAEKKGDVTVPLVVTTPDFPLRVTLENPLPLLPDLEVLQPFPVPAEGWPVIIYQHAATQDRSVILPAATAAGLLCGADDSFDCFVTIGVDLPLHGIFDEGAVGLTPIETQAGASEGSRERHFGYAGLPGGPALPADEFETPDSGSLYFNFTNFPNTTGNLRQAAIDLLNISASIPAIEAALNSCSGCNNGEQLRLNANRVYFLSHSLSGVGGMAFPHVNNQARAAGNTALRPILGQTFLNTGGHFTRTLENSKALAPLLLPTLNAASDGLLAQGRTELNIYLNVLQSLLDSVDPSAYASFYQGTPTLLTAIVGTPPFDPELGGAAADGTVPNAADNQVHQSKLGEDYDMGPLQKVLPDSGFVIASKPAPLMGTEPLADLMGVAAPAPNNNRSLPTLTRYLEGSHGNPVSGGQADLDPGSSADVFNEMLEQMLELYTDGTITVRRCHVVKDSDPAGASCAVSQNNAGFENWTGTFSDAAQTFEEIVLSPFQAALDSLWGSR